MMQRKYSSEPFDRHLREIAEVSVLPSVETRAGEQGTHQPGTVSSLLKTMPGSVHTAPAAHKQAGAEASTAGPFERKGTGRKHCVRGHLMQARDVTEMASDAAKRRTGQTTTHESGTASVSWAARKELTVGAANERRIVQEVARVANALRRVLQCITKAKN